MSSDFTSRLVPIFGTFVFLGIAFLLSEDRRSVSLRAVVWGFALQISLALLVLGVPAAGLQGPLHFVFDALNDAFIKVLEFTQAGSVFLFGTLMDTSKVGYVFALQVIPSVIFFSALSAVLYYVGLLQLVVRGISWGMQKTMGTSGAETLSAAANIFLGQTEAPLLVKPYVARMTRSELFCIMVGGMANVAGGVLAAFVGMLKDRIPDIAGHLITVSVLSGPASLLIAKIMLPETKKTATDDGLPEFERMDDANVLDALARGSSEGLSLALSVGAMLLVFISVLALANGLLTYFGDATGVTAYLLRAGFLPAGGALTFQHILGVLLSPIAWLMGIPWAEATAAGGLLGEKTALNEFVAYAHMSQMPQLSTRTVLILSYALCGFANFGSIGIQIGGIGAMAPDRRGELAQLGVRAMVGGSLTTFLVACTAAILC